MKRSTLLILLIALLGGAAIYYLEIKDGKPRDEQPETSRPAFAFKREDISEVTITRTDKSLKLESQDGKWTLKEPVSASVNESAVDTLLSDIANARVERTLSASAEEIKAYGLAEPAVTIELKLKNGNRHRIRLGTKDFSNLSVYGLIDDSNEVSILPATLLTSTDKSVNDLRDLSILGGLSQYDISSLSVKNQNGSFSLAKQNSDWVLKAPTEVPADESQVSSLLSDITTAKASEVVSETATDLASYGLAQPAITLTTQLQSKGERQINIGMKKEGSAESYFAKSSDRTPIFKIEASLFEKLNIKPVTLRSKQIIKLNQDSLTRVQIKNPNLTLITEKNSEGKWVIKEPAEQKDKEAMSSKLLEPLESNKATEVIDQPSASIAAKLAKPVIEMRLIEKEGKTTVVKISAADGESVYVRVEGWPTIYKVSKQLLDSLSFKATDIAY